MRKKSLLFCLLIAGMARGDNPLPRVSCNGVFQGFPATLNFQGASCTGIGGINAVTVALGGTATPATALTLGGLMGNGATTVCSGTDKMTGWSASGAMLCAADQAGGPNLSAEPFITKTASANLSNEFALGSLASGLLLNTTSTGVPTIYAGFLCPPDEYITSIDASGNAMCGQPIAYQAVEEDNTPLPSRSVLNFVGPTVTATDDGPGSRTNITVVASGTGACPLTQYAKTLNDGAAPTCQQVNYGQLSGVPPDISGATYVTRVAEANLSNEFALGSLATGILKNTTTTGIPTIAVSGTDYAPATSGSVLLLGNGAGAFSNYGGASSCTNQFFTGLSSAGASTCTTDTLASAQHANQGTTTQVLHGNAAGNPSWAGVALGADVSGQLPLANGGTNANLTASNGAVAYSGASALALSAVGTSGQILSSAGAGTPTWIAGPRFIRVSGSNFTTTSTTASTITGLSWSAAASTTYYFHCAVSMTGTATGGPRMLTNYSGTATSIVASITHHTTAVTTQLYTGETTAAGVLTASCAASCLTSNIPFIVQGMLSTNASGTFALQAANSTAGQTTTAFIGSACVYWTP